MRNILFIPVILALICSAAAVEAAAADRFAIVLPPDRSFMESAKISVVLKGARDAVDAVQISVNGRKQTVTAKALDRYYSCYDGISLSFGLNKIKVVGLKAGNKIDEATAQVFYRSDLSSSASSAPSGFRQYLFHTDDNEKECAVCHDLNFVNGGKQKASDKPPCYTCHKKILADYQFVHGPAAVWSCLECHDGKSRTRKLEVVKPDDKSCMNCHEKSWDDKKFQHGPTAAGNCTTCHNPHAADKPFFLRMGAGDLCAACHEEILYRPHVISSPFGGGGHPVRRSPDPFNPTKDFTCVSCHNPHGSNSAVFLNAYDEETMSMQYFCRSCHKM